MLLWGVIDSIDIFFNVFWSFLLSNRIVRRIVDYIVKKVGDCFKEFYCDEWDKYISGW